MPCAHTSQKGGLPRSQNDAIMIASHMQGTEGTPDRDIKLEAEKEQLRALIKYFHTDTDPFLHASKEIREHA